ncbi:MAG: sensor histidine kinase N-terminal domain-containing protein [Lautropia sp.]|nr:sensor histidine kinase N-terminal domain-containing protein [Lautropia sp.]
MQDAVDGEERGQLAPGRSLTVGLLLWLLPVLLIGAVLGMWRSAVSMRLQTEAAFDRSLGAVVRAIDLNVSTVTGGLALALPYQLLDFFRMTASGRVYYRVLSEDGLTDIGHADLPLPERLPPSGQVVFYDGHYFEDEPIRVGILVREMDPPLACPSRADAAVGTGGGSSCRRRHRGCCLCSSGTNGYGKCRWHW